MPLPPRALLAIAFTVTLWGSAFPAIRAILGDFPPGELALLRYLIAALVLTALALRVRPPAPRRTDLGRLLLVGALGICLYNLAINFGQRTVPAGPASFIVNTAPVLSALFAWAALGERLRPAGWLGMLVCLGGIGLIAAAESHGLRLSGGVACLGAAALLWAAYNVLHKPLLATYGALGVVTYAVWGGTLLLLPWAPSALAHAMQAPPRALALVAYLAIGPSALAYLTWSYALAQAPVTRVIPFLYAVPLVALAVGWVALGERPGPLSLGGGALIIAGLVLVNRWGRPRPVPVPVPPPPAEPS